MRSIKHTIGLIAIAGVLLTACTDKDLENIGEALLTTSQALNTLQTTVISANTSTPQLLSDNDTRAVLMLCIRINQAGLDASAVTRNLAKLESADRARLISILDPVITAVAGSVTSAGTIPDEKTRNVVMASLLLIQTSLNTAKLIAAGGN